MSGLHFTFPDGTTGPGNWNPKTGRVEPVENGLDVEKLGQALHNVYCRGNARMHSGAHHSAHAIAAEYARLRIAGRTP